MLLKSNCTVTSLFEYFQEPQYNISKMELRIFHLNQVHFPERNFPFMHLVSLILICLHLLYLMQHWGQVILSLLQPTSYDLSWSCPISMHNGEVEWDGFGHDFARTLCKEVVVITFLHPLSFSYSLTQLTYSLLQSLGPSTTWDQELSEEMKFIETIQDLARVASAVNLVFIVTNAIPSDCSSPSGK